MYRVNNQRAVRRLADRSFRASRSRNIIAVLAIALTALLFTALFTVGSGLIENTQRQTMRQAGGDGMAVLKNGVSLPISRSHLQEVKKRINDYWGAHI